MSRPDNANYRVMIKSHGRSPGTVIGWVPEQFSLRLENQWEQFYANLLENLTSGANNIGSGFGEKVFWLKSKTGHVWMGTRAINFQMTLQFDADTNVYSDVYLPVAKLIAWSSPDYDGGGFVTPPGPNLASRDNRISLRIGRFLYFDSVIVTNLDVTWHSMMHETGIPIAADVELSLQTFYTLTRQDILNVFGNGQNFDYDDSTFEPGQDVKQFGGKIVRDFEDYGRAAVRSAAELAALLPSSIARFLRRP